MKFLNLFKRENHSVIITKWTPATQESDCYILPIVKAAFEAGKRGFDDIEIIRDDNPFSCNVTFYFKAVPNAKP